MALYSGRILVRRGDEINYDPEKLMPGEWALSTDKKIVRICVSPGETIRMATYDAFEEDMEKIEEILATCQSIQEAVIRINTEVSQKADAVAEYTAQAKQYRDEAKQFRDEAETFAPSGYSELVENVEKNTVKIDTVIEKADLRIKETASGESIHLTDSADAKVVEFALYGNAKQDGTPSPDNEVDVEISGASGSVVVKSCGKNLLNHVVKSEDDFANSNSGIKVTVNPDKSITLNGKANRELYITVSNFDAKGKLWLSGLTYYNSNMGYGLFGKVTGKDIYYWDTGNGCKLNYDGDVTYWICLIVYEGATFNNETLYPMLRACDENGNPIGDDTYEPYKETTATIPTSNGLAGIDVDSGGNYTDSNGQQWVCDKIVKYADGSGEYIQRTKKKYLSEITSWYHTSGWGNPNAFAITGSDNFFEDAQPVSGFTTIANLLCNRLPISYANSVANGTGSKIAQGNGKTLFVSIEGITTYSELVDYFKNNETYVWYTLANPIRTLLTAEQIAEIEKLQTFYPVTNIFNDADCGMKVTYIVDAKRYIDNKIAELATVMVNSI